MRKFGWKKDLPDFRDLRISTPRAKKTLPSSADMRPDLPPCYDQLETGSCTANSVGALWQFTALEQFKKAAVPSRLFLYYNTRLLEGTEGEDAGATIRNTIKALAKSGICPESKWPYVEKKALKKPNQAAYDYASGKLISEYARVNQTEYDLKLQLAAGNPVAFGFSVYDSFLEEEIDKTGIMQIPSVKESMQGGHAVLLVGYDDAKRMFIVRNSWGPDWALKGYFMMPYNLVLDPSFSDDFWTITKVS